VIERILGLLERYIVVQEKKEERLAFQAGFKRENSAGISERKERSPAVLKDSEGKSLPGS
jgi:hypothetical protein